MAPLGARVTGRGPGTARRRALEAGRAALAMARAWWNRTLRPEWRRTAQAAGPGAAAAGRSGAAPEGPRGRGDGGGAPHHRRRLALLAGAAGAAVLLLVWAARGGSPRLAPEPQIIGFYENGWSALFRSSFRSLRSHYRYIDTVLAFWYSVDGQGTLHAHAPQPAVTAWAKRHHVRVGVLVNNIAGPSGDNAGMLRTAAVRARAARAIAAMVRRNGYQEVNIDFELLPPDARRGLTLFLQTLRAALPPGVTLSASVFPKLGVPSSLNGAYDYTALAHTVSYLVLMLYDNHSSGGPAGPVSPYPWVVSNVRWFLHQAHIPASKLVIGAGVYGYDWPVGSTDAQELPLTAITARARAEHARIRRDPASGNPYFRYTDAAGRPHVVWYQDRTTVRQRILLARRLRLRGVAIWALGEETPGVWTVIEETTAPAPRPGAGAPLGRGVSRPGGSSAVHA